MNNVNLKSEKASTTLGLTSSHPVKALRRRPGKSDYITTDLSANPPSRYRRYPSVRGCFMDHIVLVRPIEAWSRNLKDCVEGNQANRKADLIRFSSMVPKAPSGRQLIADKGSFDGGPGRLDHGSQQHTVRGLSKPDRADAASWATFRAALTERCFCQVLPQLKLMLNQNQALTTPVNLVGGALTCEPYLPLVGLNHPAKGEAMEFNRRI